MELGWAWTERQKLADFCGGLCGCMCVFVWGWGVAGYPDRSKTVNIWPAASLHPMCAGFGWAQSLHAHQEMFSLRCPFRRKLGPGVLCLLRPLHFLSFFPTPQEWWNPAMKGPLSVGTRRQRVLPHLFSFIQIDLEIWCANRAEHSSGCYYRASSWSLDSVLPQSGSFNSEKHE